MVVLVDEKDHPHANRRFRQAPPIPNDIRGNSLATSPRPRNNNRVSDYTDENRPHSSRGASPYSNGHSHSNGYSNGYSHGNGYSNGNGVARVSAMDALRRPASPRTAQSPLNYDQRTMRSGSSSIKDYVNGPQASVDSFRI